MLGRWVTNGSRWLQQIAGSEVHFAWQMFVDAVWQLPCTFIDRAALQERQSGVGERPSAVSEAPGCVDPLLLALATCRASMAASARNARAGLVPLPLPSLFAIAAMSPPRRLAALLPPPLRRRSLQALGAVCSEGCASKVRSSASVCLVRRAPEFTCGGSWFSSRHVVSVSLGRYHKYSPSIRIGSARLRSDRLRSDRTRSDLDRADRIASLKR